MMNVNNIEYSRYFLVVTDGVKFPSKAMAAAVQFARGYSKGLCLLALTETVTDEFAEKERLWEAENQDVKFCYYIAFGNLNDVCRMSERTETPMMFFETGHNDKFHDPMTVFKGLRELRIPFVIVKMDADVRDFSKIIVPVCYLTEEKEKAPYTSNMGRFLGSEIVVLEANDYGSKTPANVQAITTLYDKFSLKYTVVKAKKDSFKVEKEAAYMADETGAGMVVISTSRDYGLDDIIFGPKELHVLRAATTPVMCINPRGDLYVLCW
ncbi:MAG: hypothetical protein SPK91_04310 [Bacteroidales bacterium]|nr:hypothetical protein [Bacteroidales bacterium]